MSSEEGGDGQFDTSRSVVKTYVPAYQKDTWNDHADRLGMSQSEFVRTMVQAGRRDFDLDPADGASPGSNPWGDGLEDRVRDHLDGAGAVGWDELRRAVTEDLAGEVEAKLERAVGELQDDGTVRHAPREGGYVLFDGGT